MNLDRFKTHLAQTTPYPIALEVAKADGSYIYDTEGNKYLDFVGGIAVNNMGHSHPKVLKAIHEQTDKYLHVMPYGEYVFDVQLKFAEKLLGILPQKLDQCYLVNSGTEAIEAACKLAKRHTGRSGLISFKGAYHGSTQGSLSLSSNADRKNAFRPLLPGVHHLTFNDTSEFNLINEETAAVVVELVQGDAGVRLANADFIRDLGQRCAQVGALLIFDEIQTGMGRTGSMFAFEDYGVVPDVLVLGKALGAGLPLAAFIAPKQIMQSLSHSPTLGHITTFGGNPLACAAALASLNAMIEEDVVSKVSAKANLLNSLLNQKWIKETRFAGLMFAIELDSPEEVQHVIDYCRSKGLLSFYFLSAPNCFRLQPPLNVSDEDIIKASAIINEALEQVKLRANV